MVYGAVLVLPIPAGDGRNDDPGADLSVLGEESLAGGDENLVVHLQEGAADLADFIAVVLCRQTGLAQIVDFFRVAHIPGHHPHWVDVPEQALPQDDVPDKGHP